jgi:hypothetical protein
LPERASETISVLMSFCRHDGPWPVSDQHLPRLAAGEIENLRRYQIVVENHIGRLQRTHGAQRQEFGIARSRAHQRYGSGVATLLPGPRFLQQAVAVRRLRRTAGLCHGKIGKALPERTPAARR